MAKQLLSYFIVLLVFLLFPTTTQAQQKLIKIDLSSQHLQAFEDNTLIYQFPISSGKTATPTPVGTFKPWIKLPSTRMTGGNREKGTYYDLANVPFVIYFYQSYGIHGTYWHNNFGVPMSHGCVNLAPANAKLIYYWTDLNTTIQITGTTPTS